MDEYERLEADLNVQYARYLQSWRNMSFLEVPDPRHAPSQAATPYPRG